MASVLYSTGFILPANKHIIPLEGNPSNAHTSPTYRKAYNEYEYCKNAENYVAMVDLVLDLFEDTGLNEWVRGHIQNPYLSVTGWGFILDLLANKLHKTHMNYRVIPNNVKLIQTNTAHLTLERGKQVDKLMRDQTWGNVLPDLFKDQAAFQSVFNYLLVGE